MRTEEPRAIRLQDYRAPDFSVSEIALDFSLDPEATRVKATTQMARAGHGNAPLVLNGEHMQLVSLAIDGKALPPAAYTLDGEALTIPDVPDRFTLEVVTQIAPARNTALEGLYVSKGMFCTQCEAEGFRRITFFLDRPDVLARYTTRIEAPKSAYPILLSNGNPIQSGDLGDGRHFAVWDDPFPKPCYLFALVAGDLGVLRDEFVTMSGRRGGACHLCRTWQRTHARLCDGFAQARDALGRGGLWPRIRSRHLHDRRRLRLQLRRHGEQGPQHLQRQGAAGHRPKPPPTTTMPASKAWSPTNISTIGPATASPAATGSSCR